MTVLVLGPTKWRSGHTPALPPWLRDDQPHGWRLRASAMQPIDVRACIVGRLRASKCDATMMEMHPRRADETHTALYHRIVAEQGISRFFVYWPAGAQRSGVDVELGFPLTTPEAQAEVDARVFVQSDAGAVRGGSFESLEKGRRTTYYEDLPTYGCPIVAWRSYEDLWMALRHHALEW